MTILINTDKTINGDDRLQEYFSAQIQKELARFDTHISRIEVHLSDQNGVKEGKNDIRCVMEVRLEGRQPNAVTNQAENTKSAVSGAIDKMKASLDTIIGKGKNH